jgi:two-component system, NtrC family, nitrogen regulation sensor histidine kinase NtrY
MDLLKRLDAALAGNLDAAALRDELRHVRQTLVSGNLSASGGGALLETIVDHAPSAIILMDEVGTIAFTNVEARQLFFEGTRPEGQNFLQLLARVAEPLREALLSESDHIFSAQLGGAHEHYHLSRRQVEIADERYILLVIGNMTLEVSRQENAVLRKTIKIIHHEFANSITPVRSLLQTARSRIDQPDATAKLAQMLTVIDERVLHLSAFLTGFATLGRLPPPRPQEIGWDVLLGRLQPLLPGIAIAPAPSGRAWVDTGQLEQVIINLVKNAREAGATPQDVQLEVVSVPEGGYRVTVYDRGQGMSDEVLEHAVLPSFTTKPNGSGIGLTLCREIVDAHHGRLGIARREGGGVAVSVWLPPRTAPSNATSASRARFSLSRTGS